jgi:oligopeptide transport system permease protein
MVLVLLGVTFMIFCAVFALPGDPLAGKCGQRPCPEAFREQYIERFNLDDPLPIRYAKYIGNVAKGDLGENVDGETVTSEIKRTYPTTLKLATVAIAFEIVIGIGIGVLSGIRRNGVLDNGVLVSTLFLISVPVFVTGYLLQYLLGVKWGLFPITATDGTWWQLVMPGFVLASRWPTRRASPAPPSPRCSGPTTCARPRPRACRSVASSGSTHCATR